MNDKNKLTIALAGGIPLLIALLAVAVVGRARERASATLRSLGVQFYLWRSVKDRQGP